MENAHITARDVEIIADFAENNVVAMFISRTEEGTPNIGDLGGNPGGGEMIMLETLQKKVDGSVL